jgi:pSer/pThr/pTyr-binding forkhead associated (FHA) protein
MATLTVLSGPKSGTVAELPEGDFTIGRRDSCALPLPAEAVSSLHCTVLRRAGRWIVQDNGSTNGTALNGMRVREARLRHGDRIRLGNVELAFEDPDAPDAAEGAQAFSQRNSRAWVALAVGSAVATAAAAGLAWFLWRLFFH